MPSATTTMNPVSTNPSGHHRTPFLNSATSSSIINNTTINPFVNLLSGNGPFRLPNVAVSAVASVAPSTVAANSSTSANRRISSGFLGRRVSNTSSDAIATGYTDALLDVPVNSGNNSSANRRSTPVSAVSGAETLPLELETSSNSPSSASHNLGSFSHLSSVVQSITPLLSSTHLFQRAASRVIGTPSSRATRRSGLSSSGRTGLLSNSNSIDSATCEGDCHADTLKLLASMEGETSGNDIPNVGIKVSPSLSNAKPACDSSKRVVSVDQQPGTSSNENGFCGGDAAKKHTGAIPKIKRRKSTAAVIDIEQADESANSLLKSKTDKNIANESSSNEMINHGFFTTLLTSLSGVTSAKTEPGSASSADKCSSSNNEQMYAVANDGNSEVDIVEPLRTADDQQSVNKIKNTVKTHKTCRKRKFGKRKLPKISRDISEDHSENPRKGNLSDLSEKKVTGNSDDNGDKTAPKSSSEASESRVPNHAEENNESEEEDEEENEESAEDPYYTSLLWQLPVLLLMLFLKFVDCYVYDILAVLSLAFLFHLFNIVVKRNVISNRQITLGWRQCCVKMLQEWRKKLTCRRRRIMTRRWAGIREAFTRGSTRDEPNVTSETTNATATNDTAVSTIVKETVHPPSVNETVDPTATNEAVTADATREAMTSSIMSATDYESFQKSNDVKDSSELKYKEAPHGNDGTQDENVSKYIVCQKNMNASNTENALSVSAHSLQKPSSSCYGEIPCVEMTAGLDNTDKVLDASSPTTDQVVETAVSLLENTNSDTIRIGEAGYEETLHEIPLGSPCHSNVLVHNLNLANTRDITADVHFKLGQTDGSEHEINFTCDDTSRNVVCNSKDENNSDCNQFNANKVDIYPHVIDSLKSLPKMNSSELETEKPRIALGFVNEVCEDAFDTAQQNSHDLKACSDDENCSLQSESIEASGILSSSPVTTEANLPATLNSSGSGLLLKCSSITPSKRAISPEIFVVPYSSSVETANVSSGLTLVPRTVDPSAVVGELWGKIKNTFSTNASINSSSEVTSNLFKNIKGEEPLDTSSSSAKNNLDAVYSAGEIKDDIFQGSSHDNNVSKAPSDLCSTERLDRVQNTCNLEQTSASAGNLGSEEDTSVVQIEDASNSAVDISVPDVTDEENMAQESVQCVQERVQLLLVTFVGVPLVFFLYYGYLWRDEELWRGLGFLAPAITPVVFTRVLWLCLVVDFLARLCTVWVKACLCLLLLTRNGGGSVISKGKYYPVLEMVSQFYRCLLPVHPWFIYLCFDYEDHLVASLPTHSSLPVTTTTMTLTPSSPVNSESEEGFSISPLTTAFGVTETLSSVTTATVFRDTSSVHSSHPFWGFALFMIYLWNKKSDVKTNAVNLWQALKAFRANTGKYGTAPTHTELENSGGKCPICYDPYRSPRLLTCSHIFCEACIVQWFQRERICPMCRAQVADDPLWKDGATSGLPQII